MQIGLVHLQVKNFNPFNTLALH